MRSADVDDQSSEEGEIVVKHRNGKGIIVTKKRSRDELYNSKDPGTTAGETISANSLTLENEKLSRVKWTEETYEDMHNELTLGKLKSPNNLLASTIPILNKSQISVSAILAEDREAVLSEKAIDEFTSQEIYSKIREDPHQALTIIEKLMIYDNAKKFFLVKPESLRVLFVQKWIQQSQAPPTPPAQVEPIQQQQALQSIPSANQFQLTDEIVSRSGIVECLCHMTEVTMRVCDEDFRILKCDDRYKLSNHVSREFPDIILIRQCTCDIIDLIRVNIPNVGRFLITGTPGVGKTVSVMVWLYLAIKGKLMMPFRHIICDLKVGCILLTQSGGTWVEDWFQRDILLTKGFKDPRDVLYLYDAAYKKDPLLLPYCSVVFSSPNLTHFKEFIKVEIVLRVIYYTPMWAWEEIEALYCTSSTLQKRAPLSEIKKLFCIWGGLPRQILVPFQIGYDVLEDAIKNCNAVACIQILEKGSFLSYGEKDAKEVRSKLMQFEVVRDGTYQRAMVNFGSPFIRDGLVEASGKGFTNYYREFMDAHGSSKYASKVRGNLFERLVLDKLRNLSTSIEVVSFTMEAGKPNTPMTMMTLPVLPLPAKEFSDLREINEIGRVWIPQQRNFKSFDAIIAASSGMALLIQITVGASHPLNAGGVHDCIQTCEDLLLGSTIVFCLPPDIFVQWHKHNSVQSFVTLQGRRAEKHHYLNTLKQVVVCLPGDRVEEEKVKDLMKL